jgi:hypothetical protein
VHLEELIDDLEIIDQAISDRLQPLRNLLAPEGVLVRSLSNEIGESGEADVQQGDVYHVIKSGRSSPPKGLDGVSQEEINTLLVSISLPTRYGEGSCYKARLWCRALLLGWRPPLTRTPLTGEKWDFFRDEKNWTIELTFNFGTISKAIDLELQPEPEPTIKRITDIDNAGIIADVLGVS